MKRIENYENYEVSEEGFVVNLKTGRILKPDIVKKRKNSIDSEYRRVTLCENNKPQKFALHRLVALYFVDGYEEGLEVNHKDGNRGNNHFSNLEWVTPSQNKEHALVNNLLPKGVFHGNAKYTEQDVKNVLEYSSQGISRKDTATMCGVTLSFVKDVRNGRAWKHISR